MDIPAYKRGGNSWPTH